MIKFQNPHYNYDMYNGQAKYGQQQSQKQQQRYGAHGQNYMQDTFGQPSQQQQYQQQQQQQQQGQHNNYQQNHMHQPRQMSQQHSYNQQYQQHYNEILRQQFQQKLGNQQQQQQQQQSSKQDQNIKTPCHNSQQKDFNQMLYRAQKYQNEQNEKNEVRTQKNSIQPNQQEKNASFMLNGVQGSGNPQQPRLQSVDPAVLQNRSNIPMPFNKQTQYMSNGSIQNKNYDNIQKQATPMKEQVKFCNQKAAPQFDQQMMYSPMPKSQQLNETTNIAKLQQQQMLQNRSPQIQKVGGNSQGSAAFSSTNAQQLVEELAKEKEKHQVLQAKVKKLEGEKKSHNTQFLNDMENKIKQLIQQNDQLQNLNMELLQKAQNSNQDEILDLNNQIQYNTQQNEFLQKQISEAQNNLNKHIKQYQDLEIQYKEKTQQEEQQIQYLVQDLEEKVHGLIEENERLNTLIQQQESNPKREQLQNLQNEQAKLIQLTNSASKDVQSWRNKYEQLQKKFQQAQNEEPQDEQVENLEEKIRKLIEENDYLNSIVQQQIEKENQIALLEEEMQNLVEQNDNLEMLVAQQKK